jgi:hypothetical protein
MHDWYLTPWSSHVVALSWEKVGEIEPTEGFPRISEVTAYGTLHVAFKSGKIYSYEGVSIIDYDTIKYAKSVGGALHRLGVTNPRGRRHTLIGRFDPETGEALRDPR